MAAKNGAVVVDAAAHEVFQKLGQSIDQTRQSVSALREAVRQRRAEHAETPTPIETPSTAFISTVRAVAEKHFCGCAECLTLRSWLASS